MRCKGKSKWLQSGKRIVVKDEGGDGAFLFVVAVTT